MTPPLSQRALLAALTLAATIFGTGCGTPAEGPPSTTAKTLVALQEPLPETAFKVEWKPVILPPSMQPGQSYAIAVAFTNKGNAVWPDPRMADPAGTTGGERSVRLSYRWLKHDGSPQSDYITRAELYHPLPPGGSAALAIEVVAPAQPGEYQLQFDLVQEMVAWFGDKPGVPKLVAPLTVR